MMAIVTVKLSKNPRLNPQHKITGKCPLNVPEILRCTDTTGEHHSYVEFGNTLSEIRNKAIRKYGHVTRIEELDPKYFE